MFIYLIFKSRIVFDFLQSTVVSSFHEDVIFTLFMKKVLTMFPFVIDELYAI